MDIDYAIRKDEPPIITDENAITDENIPTVIALYEWWEWSNWLSVIFIKTKILAEIRGSIDQHEKVWDLLKAIDDQFITSDMVLASTLIMIFYSFSLTSVKGVSVYIMHMRDISAQRKKLEVGMFVSFLVHFILRTLSSEYGLLKISYNTHKGKWSINELMTLCVQEQKGL